ncbi:SagB/ThcOx family dehydrogenase [Acaryochloris sp. IP29b_bin.148]|uniref:SagB/ThcOx family dehydrogenase n=1 Tax=Acaryochloris sp. IP29b_bin.148 TaxID=2969218 RepID=UPI002637A136|nr:SagB/ThcOx family dehydrogenase [Acaryochloris sp. IP29b_bin.148]
MAHAFSITQHYHQRTKYEPETISQRSRALDFNQQPVPFKDYKFGTTIGLKEYLEPGVDPTQAQWQRLSRLLYCSYGITAVIPYPDNPLYLRTAPSAGGLYPAELYVIAGEGTLLPAGLYSYQVRTHSLLRFWDSHVWSALETACLWHPALAKTQLALVVTAVFQRSAWRYEDRAYRRICLDSGHLLGNIELAASICDFKAHLIGGFADQPLNQLLYLDADQEGVVAAIALADLLDADQNLPPAPTVLPSPTLTDYPQIPDGELLLYTHKATCIQTEEITYNSELSTAVKEDQYNFPFCLKVPLSNAPIDWGAGLVNLKEAILKRRSTRRFTGGSLSLQALSYLLSFTYCPDQYQAQSLDGYPDFFDLGLIQTFMAVLDVTDLETGCYYYAVQAQELRQIRFKNFRREAHYLCLGQDLGRDAAVILFHTANLQSAIARYGDRAYRYLHMDAGHLGQRLNLAATHLNLGVSGIGGFFDDQVNEVLGIPAEEAVLYITTLGQPPPPAE